MAAPNFSKKENLIKINVKIIKLRLGHLTSLKNEIILLFIKWAIPVSHSGEILLSANYSETNFKPTIEIISVLKKKMRQKWAGSLKTRIPNKTVPTAPIPVQTA